MENESNHTAEIITQSLQDLGYPLEISDTGYIEISGKDLGEYANRLRRISGKPQTWKGKYIRNILNGHVEPGEEIRTAVIKLAGAIDGVSPAIVGKEKIEVYADPELVKPNSIILGESKKCKYPPCPVYFIGRSDYCCPGCKQKKRNMVRINKRAEQRRLKSERG